MNILINTSIEKKFSKKEYVSLCKFVHGRIICIKRLVWTNMSKCRTKNIYLSVGITRVGLGSDSRMIITQEEK